MIRMTIAAAAFALAPLAVTAGSDEIAETLNSALQAYEDGDIQYALDELEYAKQLLQGLKSEALTVFLPDAPDGWVRQINSELGSGIGALFGGGGGVTVQAEYTNESNFFSVTLMADSPMVGALGGMIANAAAVGAKIKRIDRQKFMVQNQEISALIDNRILVQAKGANTDLILEVLATIDFRKLGRFGL